MLAATAVVAAALGAGAVALADDGDEPAEVPVPAVAKGAQVLGSDLGRPGPLARLPRRQPRAGARSPARSFRRKRPGAQLIAPADGTIVAWSVRGARGELALDVIRPGGDDTIRVSRSQWETAGNVAPHRFRTDLPVERGDQIGVQMGPGARIGVRDSDDATTQRWLRALGGFYGRPDRGAGNRLRPRGAGASGVRAPVASRPSRRS